MVGKYRTVPLVVGGSFGPLLWPRLEWHHYRNLHTFCLYSLIYPFIPSHHPPLSGPLFPSPAPAPPSLSPAPSPIPSPHAPPSPSPHPLPLLASSHTTQLELHPTCTPKPPIPAKVTATNALISSTKIPSRKQTNLLTICEQIYHLLLRLTRAPLPISGHPSIPPHFVTLRVHCLPYVN